MIVKRKKSGTNHIGLPNTRNAWKNANTTNMCVKIDLVAPLPSRNTGFKNDGHCHCVRAAAMIKRHVPIASKVSSSPVAPRGNKNGKPENASMPNTRRKSDPTQNAQHHRRKLDLRQNNRRQAAKRNRIHAAEIGILLPGLVAMREISSPERSKHDEHKQKRNEQSNAPSSHAAIGKKR